MEMPTIPQSPPHVQGPEDLRPLHDGVESPQPPEVEVGNQEEQHQLAPIPLQTSRDADCQVQFAQQQLLQQGDRHANGHVNVLRQVQFKTSKTFTNQSDKKLVSVTTFNFVKVALLTQLEELLIRNRAMCLILCLGHIYFVVLLKTAPFLGLKSIVFGPNCYVTTANRSAIYPLSL